MSKIPANITITRTNSCNMEVSIILEMGSTRHTFRLSLEDYALLITGRSNMPIEHVKTIELSNRPETPQGV